MNASITFYTIAIILVIVSSIKDKQKTKFALIKAYKSFMGLMPSLIAMVIFVGLLLTFVSPSTIGKVLGEDSGFKGIMWAFILGTIGAGPTYGAFPVAALLIKKGARIAYAIFFLGIWSAVKLPLAIFESTAMGMKKKNKNLQIKN